MKHWEMPRSTTGVRHLVAEGQSRGLSAETCLSGTTLDPARLEDLTGTVAAWEEIAVAGNLATALSHVASLGVAVGRRQHVSTFGATGIGMLASTNLFSALSFAKAFSPLLPALCSVTAHIDGGRTSIRFDGRRLPAPARALLVERDLTALVQCMREVSGQRGTLLAIEVDHDVPPTDAWDHHFGVKSQRAKMTTCVLDVAFMVAPLPQADPLIEAQAREQCQRLMTERKTSDTVVNQVLDRLWNSSPDLPGLDDLARSLLTTERTLRRRLAEEGTTFRALTDQVQFSIAHHLLGMRQMTVQQIAQHLGYGDTSAFTHAFRRWTGKSPRAYRTEASPPSQV